MKQITAFVSNRGSHFDNAVDALKDDLKYYLSDAAENEAIGIKLADKIMSSDFEPLCTILTELRAAVKSPQFPLEQALKDDRG